MAWLTLPVAVVIVIIAFSLKIDKITFSIVFLAVFIVYSWWTTTSEEAEETDVPFILLMAIGAICYEGLMCGLNFFRQQCSGAALGVMFLAHAVIVFIKRNR